MNNSKAKFQLTKIACMLNAIFFTGLLCGAEAPTSLSRLSFINGTVTISPAGSKDWANATLNRPLVSGDRIWDDIDAKSEIQFKDSAIRMGAKTSVNAINLLNKTAQIQLSQGSVCMRVRTMDSDQIYEVDTPNLAFSVLQPGDYRIDVSEDGKTTTVTVKTGGSQVSSEGTSYKVDANKSYNFTGTKLEHTAVTTASTDDFDSWCSERNALLGPIQSNTSTSTSASSKENVSDQIPGSAELNKSGTWSQNKTYGKSWTPSDVPSGWKPYTDGRWVWISSIGWTWVDNAPWGYAPIYYGRWVLVDGVWSWIPGDTYGPPVFVPAGVGFLNGLGYPDDPLLGWFPLLPGELYIPPYENFPNNPGPYVNMSEPGMITAMSLSNFVNSKQVKQATVPVSPGMLDKAKMSNTPKAIPTETSLMGGNAKTKTAPPPDVLKRIGIAKTTPPPAPIPFDATLPFLKKHPGMPLSQSEIDSLKPGDWTDIVVIKNCPPPKPIDEVARPPITEPKVITHPPIQVTPTPTESKQQAPVKTKKPKQVKPKNVIPHEVKPHTPKKRKPRYPKYYPGTQPYHYPRQQYYPPQYHYPRKQYYPPQYHYPKQQYYPPQYHYPRKQYYPPQYHYPQPRYTPPASGGGSTGGGHGH